MNRVYVLLASAVFLSGIAFAQSPGAGELQRTFTVQAEPGPVWRESLPMMLQNGSWERGPAGEIAFLSAELAGNQEVIKNAPYTANATTESTQTLADGNRITNKTAAFLARDGQGRTRREQTIGRMGPLHVEGPKVVFINDPVTHTDYILRPDEHNARIAKRMEYRVTTANGGELNRIFVEGAPNRHEHELNGAEPDSKFFVEGELKSKIEMKIKQKQGPGGEPAGEPSDQVTHEVLPKQDIEGVSCEGRRETRTIPAGQIGNELPLQISTETWYSPELHVAVLKKHTDPRFGETVYRLTNIKVGEPDASMFQVPSGYATEKSLPRLATPLPKD